MSDSPDPEVIILNNSKDKNNLIVNNPDQEEDFAERMKKQVNNAKKAIGQYIQDAETTTLLLCLTGFLLAIMFVFFGTRILLPTKNKNSILANTNANTNTNPKASTDTAGGGQFRSVNLAQRFGSI
jgi:hypothetical protein